MMTKRIAIWLIVFLGTAISTAFAKDGFNIKLKVNGLKDEVCYLAYHFGNKVYVQDTYKMDNKGVVIFKGKDPLPGGIYLAVLPKSRFFEVLYSGNETEFSLETDTLDLINHLKVTGSAENAKFNAYQRQAMPFQKTLKELSDLLQKTKSEDSIATLKVKIKATNDEFIALRKKVIEQNKGTFFAKIIQSIEDPTVPDNAPKQADGKVDEEFAYKYIKNHYWDNVDCQDERMARTPIFHNKIMYYMENLVPKHPDSLSTACQYIIEKCRGNKELFKYAVITLTHNYETSKIMGMDAVFSALAEKYYLGGEAYWADTSTLRKIRERVIKIKPNLIGKTAPPLFTVNTEGQNVNLADIQSPYTVVLFWSYSCGHCKKSMPEYIDAYNKLKDKGVTFLAICTNNDKNEWTKFIQEHKMPFLNVYDPYNRSNFHTLYDIYSTPTIYVLDKDKKIIAKRIGPEQIEMIIDHYEKGTIASSIKEKENHD